MRLLRRSVKTKSSKTVYFKILFCFAWVMIKTKEWSKSDGFFYNKLPIFKSFCNKQAFANRLQTFACTGIHIWFHDTQIYNTHPKNNSVLLCTLYISESDQTKYLSSFKMQKVITRFNFLTQSVSILFMLQNAPG